MLVVTRISPPGHKKIDKPVREENGGVAADCSTSQRGTPTRTGTQSRNQIYEFQIRRYTALDLPVATVQLKVIKTLTETGESGEVCVPVGIVQAF